jgi:DNA-binding transcriptional ArsR family regulator
MIEKKYVLVSLDDAKTGKIAEVLGNKTCKIILELLSEEEFSEKDISDRLNIPMNTVNYNVKKLKEVGLIEEKKHFFSIKGKRIPVYRVSNKSIIISPKKSSFSKIKNFLPVVIIASLFSIFLLWYDKTRGKVPFRFSEDLFAGEPTVLESLNNELTGFTSSFSFGLVEYFLIFIWVGIVLFFAWCYISERRFNKNGKID